MTSSIFVADLKGNIFGHMFCPPSFVVIALIFSELRSGGRISPLGPRRPKLKKNTGSNRVKSQMNNFSHIGIADACFNNPVGVADPDIIPDNQFSASSYYLLPTSYYPYHGRLNQTRGYGWCASSCCDNQDWLQVDLGRIIEICGVATQGHRGGDRNSMVTDFKLSFSFDGNVWNTYLDTNSTPKVRFEFR